MTDLVREMDLIDAYDLGRTGFYYGDTNPYHPDEKYDEYLEWERGYEEASENPEDNMDW